MSQPPVPWLIRARLSLAMTCFVVAARISGALRGVNKLRCPPPGIVCLPADDADPAGRAAAIAEARRRYPLTPLAKLAGVEGDLGHQTLAVLPPEEAYPPLVKLAKAFLLLGAKLVVASESRWESIAEVRASTRALETPAVADRWDDDGEFARQRLQGANPVWIRRAGEIAGLGLGEAARAALAGEDPSRLYVVDYRAVLRGVTTQPGRYLYPCVAVFREAAHGGIEVVGIALDRSPGDAPWFAPGGGPAWTLAKMFFQSADMWVHESVTHLLWTHLVAEKFVLAASRNLSWNHPIRCLLAPAQANTLQVNQNATRLLLAPGGFLDGSFAVDQRSKIATLVQASPLWRFEDLMFPDDVTRRGMDGLPAYPYRDDGRLLWDAVVAYARDFVALVYPSDEAVGGDLELQAFASELTGEIGAQGFPGLPDRARLFQVCAAVLFCPIRHDLIGTPQFAFYGFCPAQASHLRTPMPANPAEVDAQTLIAALPDVGVSMSVMSVTYAFSLQYDHLGAHPEVFHSGEALKLARGFQEALRGIGAEIAVRNQARAFPYEASSPTRMSASIAV